MTNKEREAFKESLDALHLSSGLNYRLANTIQDSLILRTKIKAARNKANDGEEEPESTTNSTTTMVILQLLLLVLLQLLVQLLLLKVNQNSQARKIMRHNHLNLPRRIINQHHNSKALRRKEIRNRAILKRKRLNQNLMQANHKTCRLMMMVMLLE